MSGAATAVMADAAVIGAGATIYSGMQQKKGMAAAAAQQAAAQQQATVQANKAAAQADIAQNQANQKRPNVAGVMDAMSQRGKSGASGTMLTGSQGVDPNALNLGKSTLLGQ